MLNILKLLTFSSLLLLTCTNAAPVNQQRTKPSSRFRKAVIKKNSQALMATVGNDCEQGRVLYKKYASQTLATVQVEDKTFLSQLSKTDIQQTRKDLALIFPTRVSMKKVESISLYQAMIEELKETMGKLSNYTRLHNDTATSDHLQHLFRTKLDHLGQLETTIKQKLLTCPEYHNITTNNLRMMEETYKLMAKEYIYNYQDLDMMLQPTTDMMSHLQKITYVTLSALYKVHEWKRVDFHARASCI
ncbi:uncharacterized protein [Clytia hemisphaerica]|uniref:Uncharacterized protein n=1 Tax=Clytia hemisphaerica TaxID=252671 RepID=A0A7M5UM09_9CNID